MAQPARSIVELPATVIGDLADADSSAPRGVVRTATIRLPSDLFELPPPGDDPPPIVRIPTGEDSFVELVEERRITRDGQTYIFGHDLTQEHATFMLTREHGSISRGEIERDDELITLTGPELANLRVKFRLVVWKPSAFFQEEAPNEARTPTRGDVSDEAGDIGDDLDIETDQADEPDETLAPVEIDIMVVYTPEAAAKAPLTTLEDIQTTIGALVRNASLRMEFQANVKLNLVHVEEVDYVETGSMATDLDRLECPCDHKKKGVGDNHLNEVFDAWKSSDADIVSLWIHSDTQTGFGNILGDVDVDWAPRAVHVVAWSAAVGRYSFDHELGHQLGARHNWEEDNTSGKPYVFNHGYVNLGPDKVTIMAYESTCSIYATSCTRRSIWSDPNYPLAGGPWGVALPSALPAYNALTLQSSAPTVSLFNTRHDLVGCCLKEGSIFSRTYRPGQCP